MSRNAAVSEILGSIIVLAVGSIVAISLFFIFSETDDDTKEILDDRLDLQEKKASELLVVSHVSREPGKFHFLLHNYGNIQLDSSEFVPYLVDENGDIIKGNPDFLYISPTDGEHDTDGISLINPRTSSVVTYVGGGVTCGETLILLTPADEIIIIGDSIPCECHNFKVPNDSGDGCICPNTLPIQFGGKCYADLSCTDDTVQIGGECICTFDRIKQGDKCHFPLPNGCTPPKVQIGDSCKVKPSCIGGTLDDAYRCQCPTDNTEYNGKCYVIQNCTGDLEQQGDTCECPAGKKHREGNSCYKKLACTGSEIQQANSCVTTLACTGNKVIKNGVCICPANLPHEYKKTCYAKMDCTDGKIQQGNSCVCPTNIPIFVNGTCEAKTQCKANQDYISSTNSCRDKNPCTGNKIVDNNKCVCPAGMTHKWKGSCYTSLQCAGNLEQQGDKCGCPSNLPVKEGALCFASKCTGGKIRQYIFCVCPTGTILEKGICYKDLKCTGDLIQSNNKCVCPTGKNHKEDNRCYKIKACTGGREQNQNSCVCPTNKPIFVNGTCEAKTQCTANQDYISSTNSCRDKNPCTGNKVLRNDACVCPTDKPHEHSGTCYITKNCGGGTQQGNSCNCNSGYTLRNDTCVKNSGGGNDGDVQTCTNGKVWNGSSCVCPSGKVWYRGFCNTPDVPDAPLGVTVKAGYGNVLVKWSAPANGGSYINSFEIHYTGSKDNGFTSSVTVSNKRYLEKVISGLTNGETFRFWVTATNGVGTSTNSKEISAMPSISYGTTTITSVKSGNKEITVDWSYIADKNRSGVTYTLQYKRSSDTNWTTFKDGMKSTLSTVTGLTQGVSYDFRVAAVFSNEQYPWSVIVAAIPATKSDAPTSLTATAGNGKVTLSWTAPADNGGAKITDYTIIFKETSRHIWKTFHDGTSTATTAIVTGLTNDISYDFIVAATNSVGDGKLSGKVSATPS